MELDEIFETFKDRLVDIEVLRRAGKDVATREFKKYLELAQQAERHPNRAHLCSSIHAMYYQDAQTGEAVAYGDRELSAQDGVRRVGQRKNREYCWLLVEAYEEFERCMERVYAFLGKWNPEAWPLEDFGNVKWPELGSKNFGWYLNTVKRRYRQRPKEILNRLRAKYPDLETVERTNKLGTNLRVAVELIESLRHKVVHARGEVADLEKFTARVLERCGLWNSGRPNEDHRAFVQRYFRPCTDGGHVVTLLEVRAGPEGVPLEFFLDVFGMLIGYLMTYADLVKRSVSGEDILAEPKGN